MEIVNKDNEQILEIWLTQAEKADRALRSSLYPLYDMYKRKKYLVAVFESGERNLIEGTMDLVMYNRGL